MSKGATTEETHGGGLLEALRGTSWSKSGKALGQGIRQNGVVGCKAQIRQDRGIADKSSQGRENLKMPIRGAPNGTEQGKDQICLDFCQSETVASRQQIQAGGIDLTGMGMHKRNSISQRNREFLRRPQQ